MRPGNVVFTTNVQNHFANEETRGVATYKVPHKDYVLVLLVLDMIPKAEIGAYDPNAGLLKLGWKPPRERKNGRS